MNPDFEAGNVCDELEARTSVSGVMTCIEMREWGKGCKPAKRWDVGGGTEARDGASAAGERNYAGDVFKVMIGDGLHGSGVSSEKVT